MDESKMFATRAEAGGGADKEQLPVKPFIKKIEARSDTTCFGIGASCGKKIKKGEEMWLVLTKADIEEGLERGEDCETIRSSSTAMCKDCLDEKLLRDSGQDFFSENN